MNSESKIWLRMERNLDMNPYLVNRKYGGVDLDGPWRRIHVARVLISSILDFYNNSDSDDRFSAANTWYAPIRGERAAYRPFWSSNQAGWRRLQSGIRDHQNSSKNLHSKSLPPLFLGLGEMGHAGTMALVDPFTCLGALSERWSYRRRWRLYFYPRIWEDGPHSWTRQWPCYKKEDVGKAVSAVSVIFLKELCRYFLAVANKSFTKMRHAEWVATTETQNVRDEEFPECFYGGRTRPNFFLMFISVSVIGAVRQQARPIMSVQLPRYTYIFPMPQWFKTRRLCGWHRSRRSNSDLRAIKRSSLQDFVLQWRTFSPLFAIRWTSLIWRVSTQCWISRRSVAWSRRPQFARGEVIYASGKA